MIALPDTCNFSIGVIPMPTFPASRCSIILPYATPAELLCNTYVIGVIVPFTPILNDDVFVSLIWNSAIQLLVLVSFIDNLKLGDGTLIPTEPVVVKLPVI